MKTVYHIVWVESEAGWGQRPDGETFHKDKETMEAYRKKYSNAGNENYYSYAHKTDIVEVSEETYNIVQNKGTVWKHNTKEK